jgi:AcrR family transcriptional regulator
MSKIISFKNRTKRDTIRMEAAQLFRKRGYATTTMRELAEAVGVEASSLYNHIGSKADILKEICFQVATSFLTHLKTLDELNQDPTEKMESLIRFHIHMMLDDLDAVFVANHEWKQLKEPDLGDFLQMRRKYESSMTELVNQGMKTGKFRTANPAVVVFTILSALRGLELWQGQKKNISKQELEAGMLQQLLNGLLK